MQSSCAFVGGMIPERGAEHEHEALLVGVVYLEFWNSLENIVL